MSAVQSRLDPFSDPATQPRPLPPLPPKSTSSSHNRMPPAIKKTALPTHNDIAEAVRDTVTVRGSTDYSPRNRVERSLTAASPSQAARPTQPRSQSQDSATRPDKSKPATKTRSKKGSQHADVIDRLDFTGVGPMFHHDGPFDACAPSRNKQHNKAPMLAWTPRPDERPPAGNSAYPSSDAYKAFSDTKYDPPKKKVDAIAEAWGIHEPEPFEEFFAGGGTGRTDGDTPASSIYNGRESHSKNRHTNAQKRPKDGQEIRDPYRDYLESGPTPNADGAPRPRGATRRALVPPPQPIFAQHDELEMPLGTSPPLSPGSPKRSKSLMHRIRKMRDAPNVPVSSSDYDPPPSPTSPPDMDGRNSRPTHRSQNSFLGRFGGSRNAQSSSDKSEPFVYIEPQNNNNNNKDLPAPPQGAGDTPPEVTVGYFDGPNNSSGGNPTSPGLGRKTSLMKKVGRVVGRSRQ